MITLKGRNILVIDDDSSMRSLVVDFLTGKGHLVTESDLAFNAFERIRKGDFSKLGEDGNEQICGQLDLIITDLNMPHMTGNQFIENFRVLAPKIPIILMSGTVSNEHGLQAIRNGAFGYTTKPFKLNDLATLVREALISPSSPLKSPVPFVKR